MASRHPCQGSDHISKIAADEGFRDWRTVWNANGPLQGSRQNPNVLFKGDRLSQGDTLTIPDTVERDEPGATEVHHPFVTRRQPVFLRLRILKDDFTAISGANYTLTVEGVPTPFTGTTDANGQLQHEVPRAAQRGELTIRVPAPATDNPPSGASPAAPPGGTPPASANGDSIRGDVPVTWQLQIGALNPIMENAPDRWCISGVQQRLNNLALNTGPIDGIRGPNTKAAVAAFQDIFGLTVDEKPGQLETQPKLVEVHDMPDSVLGPAPAPTATSGASPSSSQAPTT